MTNEDFEEILRDLPENFDASPSQEIPEWLKNCTPEKQQALLARLHLQRERFDRRTYDLSRLLLRAGVPASDEAVTGMMEAQAALRFPFRDHFPMPEFVEWVEQAEAGGRLSIRLLTCLRKHLPAIIWSYPDKASRLLMRRLSIALKLWMDAPIPAAVDAWTAVALEKRETLPPDSRQQWEALLALADRQKSAKPGKAWLKEAQALASSLPEFSQIMRDILESLGRDGPVGVRFLGYVSWRKNILDKDFTDLLRALVWLCAPYPELVEPLCGAAARCVTKIPDIGPLSSKIAAACTDTLSRQQNPSATRAIFELQSGVKHKTTRKGLAKAIAQAEARSGMSRDVLEESTVPDLGFSAGDYPAREAGGEKVVLSISNAGVPVLLLENSGGGSLRNRLPKSAEAKALLREVRKVLEARSPATGKNAARRTEIFR